MSTTRIYAVKNRATGSVSLVRATSASQGVRRVTRDLFDVAVASQETIVAALQDGAKVVDASEKGEQE